MSPDHRRGRRRLLVAVAGVVVLLGIAAVVVRVTLLHDRSRAVPVEVTRARYRSTTTTSTSTAASATAPEAAPASPPAPVPAGVFRYRTTGQESVDVLGGATHHYPAETTITVTSEGCGVRLRWDALVERRDEWELCATPEGIKLQRRGSQYHQFFGRAEAEDVVCDRPVLVVPVRATAAPAPVTQTCTLGADPWLPTWTVLDATTRTVDGSTVAVRHVAMVVDDQDEYWEHTVVDWYLAADGLPVEVTVAKQSRSPSPIGGVVYRETGHLELISRVPLT